LPWENLELYSVSFFLLLVGGLTRTRLWKKGSWFQGGRGLGMGMVSGWLAFLGGGQVVVVFCSSIICVFLAFFPGLFGELETLGLWGLGISNLLS
jgi:hypothetical protein